MEREEQKQIRDKIIEKLKSIGEEIRENEDSESVSIRASQMDVLLDTIRFLDRYDENVKVLNKYWIEKHQQEKFKER
ncbi:MAG: hypothetical protein IJF92_00610 [Bacilli bacterium]|nr:hypothetical protein [Bacilli bacterium]MBQ3307685.1 hypothetical protein [Bacilli bacterium]